MRFSKEEMQRKVLSREQFYELMTKKFTEEYDEKEKVFTEERLREIEHWVMLQIIDSWWKDHLHNIDHLKEGIGLRGYSQRDPLQEYKKEAFELFKRFVTAIKQDTLQMLFKIHPEVVEQFAKEVKKGAESRAKKELRQAKAKHQDPEEALESLLEAERTAQIVGKARQKKLV